MSAKLLVNTLISQSEACERSPGLPRKIAINSTTARNGTRPVPPRFRRDDRRLPIRCATGLRDGAERRAGAADRGEISAATADLKLASKSRLR